MQMNRYSTTGVLCAALILAACGGKDDTGKTDKMAIPADPFPSTYEPYPNGAVFITNATIIDGTAC